MYGQLIKGRAGSQSEAAPQAEGGAVPAVTS